MKIVHIIPGSGDTFYCENCMRDGALVKALRRLGHDVVIMPMYLPLFRDNPDVSRDTPVFFGGINVYLQQRFKLFRNTPRWIDRIFDSRVMLKLAARQASSTKADNLGDMTLSMLKGKDGNQAKELERMISWIRENEKPDIIHISNVLLIGLVKQLKETMNVPVVCSLQDEDTWIDAMKPPFNTLCWDMIRKDSAHVDAFISVSNYYAQVMMKHLNIPADRMHVAHLGIDLDGYGKSGLPDKPAVLGFMARMSRSQGLDIMVDAFIELKKRPAFTNSILKATGGETADDKEFRNEITARLDSNNILNSVEFIPSFDRAERIEFLKSLTVLSVPVPDGGAFGNYILEALASGVPVVQPDVGAFPEIIKETGGGVLFSPNKPEILADTIEKLISNRSELTRLAETGKQAVNNKFGIEHMASRLLKIYSGLI